MSPTIGLPPPEPESCLVQSRASRARYKGGTLIQEDVRDLETHERRVRDPDAYRPEACPRCKHPTLHVHCYPQRRPIGEAGGAVAVRVVQYICASPGCRATWRILPMILARHLWRWWRTVERTVKPADTQSRADAPRIPERTERRWRARLATSAAVVIALLAQRGDSELMARAAASDRELSRMDLIDTFARWTSTRPGFRLSAPATVTHTLERGIRVM